MASKYLLFFPNITRVKQSILMLSFSNFLVDICESGSKAEAVCPCREAFAAEASSSQHGSEGAGQPGTVSTGKVKPKTGRRRDLSQPKKVGPVYVQLVSKVGRPKASGA